MSRKGALVAGIVSLSLAVVLALLVAVRPDILEGIDGPWNVEMGQWRFPALVGFAMVMNAVGGGWIAVFVVPPGLALLVLLLRGWRFAIFVLVVFLASAVAVQAVKHAVGRARPQDMLIVSDFGSFPSGHTANAATIAVVLCLLFPGALAAVSGALWVFAMAFSRTVLSVHWLSDTVGGVLVGAGVSLVLAALLWSLIRRPGARAAGPVGSIDR